MDILTPAKLSAEYTALDNRLHCSNKVMQRMNHFHSQHLFRLLQTRPFWLSTMTAVGFRLHLTWESSFWEKKEKKANIHQWNLTLPKFCSSPPWAVHDCSACLNSSRCTNPYLLWCVSAIRTAGRAAQQQGSWLPKHISQHELMVCLWWLNQPQESDQEWQKAAHAARVRPSKDSAVVTNFLLPGIPWWFCTVPSHTAWEDTKTAPSSELTTQRNTLLDKDRHQPQVSYLSGQSCHVPSATQEHSISQQNKISPSPWVTVWSRNLQSHDSEGLKSPCTCSHWAILWATGKPLCSPDTEQLVQKWHRLTP